MSFQLTKRPRRLRATAAIRNMVAETALSVDNLIVPLFISEGQNKKEAITSMPGYFRLSLDLLKGEILALKSLG